MKFFAINGSPRKTFSTAKLLDKSLKGIQSIIPDSEVKRIDLYDIPFNGCKSCFACKKINGRHYGKCVYNDDFKPILNEIVQADGLILGSPVYFGDLTGNMRCFLERLMFPFFVYDFDNTSIAPKRMPLAFIYTMNVKEDVARKSGYIDQFSKYENNLEGIFTKPDSLYVFDTYQFSDYSKYKMDIFKEADKRKTLETQFPKDLENAFKIGQIIAEKSVKKVL